MTHRRFHSVLHLGLLALAASAPLLGGCRGERSNKPPRQFFPDMDDQEKYKAQAKSGVFRDGRTMQPPPAGTVAFGVRPNMAWGHEGEEQAVSATRVSRERDDLLKESAPYYTGRGADGNYVETIPIPVTMALLNRGQERFNIFCTPCHGYLGDGKGMVGQQWSYAMPTFHDPKYDKGSADPDGRGRDGFVFWTIRNGVANAAGQQPPLKMPSYRNQVNEHDAWAITAYFRALRHSQAFPIEKVPDTLKGELQRLTGKAASAGGSGQTGAPGSPVAPTEVSR